MSTMKWIGRGLIALLVVFGVLVFDYYLPDGRVGYVTATRTKIKDLSGLQGKTNAPIAGSDVDYISTIDLDRDPESARAYRNEDAVIYFKWDSSTLWSRAEAWAEQPRDQRDSVLITYYGWRVEWLSMFPNVINIKQVDPDYTYIPYTRIGVIIVLIGLGVLGFIGFRRARRKIEQIAHEREQAKARDREAQERERAARREAETDQGAVDDFISSRQQINRDS